jgi:hypothetical protein
MTSKTSKPSGKSEECADAEHDQESGRVHDRKRLATLIGRLLAQHWLRQRSTEGPTVLFLSPSDGATNCEEESPEQ